MHTYMRMMSKMKYVLCYRFKFCLLNFAIFVILVTLFGHAFVSPSNEYSINSFDELDNPVNSSKKWIIIPYIVNVIVNDHQLYTSAERYELYASSAFDSIEISYLTSPVILQEAFIASKDVIRVNAKEKLSELGDFYSFIKRPQFHCHKLVRMGGSMECKGDARKHSHMDGDKLVCMDPQMELHPRKNPHECLTLSFGILTDTTFDEAIADFNCEIHMFDPIDYKPPHETDKAFEHAHFHLSALDAKDIVTFYEETNFTVKHYTLHSQLATNGLLGRPIHILKMDIEIYEWDVLEKDLLKSNLLDIVGQISMEIHSSDLLWNLKNTTRKRTTTEKIAVLQERYNILRGLESHGFLPVAYWDNVQDAFAIYDDEGRRFETAGEILYVNTNWYNKSFKQNLVKGGIELRIS